MKRADRKSKAPQRRKPPHHAPIQRGSSGVMSNWPGVYQRGHMSRVGSDNTYYWYYCCKQIKKNVTCTHWYRWRQHQHILWYKRSLRWSHKLGQTLMLKIGYLQEKREQKHVCIKLIWDLYWCLKKKKKKVIGELGLSFTPIFSRGQYCTTLKYLKREEIHFFFFSILNIQVFLSSYIVDPLLTVTQIEREGDCTMFLVSLMFLTSAQWVDFVTKYLYLNLNLNLNLNPKHCKIYMNNFLSSFSELYHPCC